MSEAQKIRIGLAVIALFGAASLFIYKELDDIFGSGRCSADRLKRVQSPNKGGSASVIRVNCGATERFAYIVSFSESRDIATSQDYFFSKDGLDDIEIVWTDDSSLVVNYGTGSVYRQAVIWNGTHISYNKK